jgi:small subunit ribosomal protein S7
MPRKYRSTDKLQKPDAVYGDRVIQKFINNLMHCGKKSTAQRVFYRAMDRIGRMTKEKPANEIFMAALSNIRPKVEVKSRRVGGATYQVPVQIKEKRALSLAMKWLLTSVRTRGNKASHVRLAEEVLSAYKGEGAAVKKRDDVHKMAEANRAFAHLAF